jgi:hypothetical protein
MITYSDPNPESPGPFKIENLTGNIKFAKVNNPLVYGFSADTSVVTGEFKNGRADLSWSVYKPGINSGIASLNEIDFDRIKISLLDRNNELVKVLENGIKTKKYSFSSAGLSSLSHNTYNDDNFLRETRLKVESFTQDGKTSAGVFILDAKKPVLSNLKTTITDSVKFSFDATEAESIKKIALYVSTKKGSIEESDLVTSKDFLPANSLQYKPESATPYYYKLVPIDSYSTGQFINTNLIKVNTVNSQFVDNKPQNITGAIKAHFNTLSKTFDVGAFVKWSPNSEHSELDYEVFVFESGTAIPFYSFSVESPVIDNVSQIIQGTGANRLDKLQRGINPYYSGVDYIPVFSPSGSNGVQWRDHTLVLDSKGLFPTGTYANPSASLTEIEVPAGSLNANELYLVYNYNGSDFEFFPSSGAYNDTPYGGSIVGTPSSGPTGPLGSGPVFVIGATGVLIAERFNPTFPQGFDFCLAANEPRALIPFHETGTYRIKVRAKTNSNDYTNFSDDLIFTESHIQNSITGFKSYQGIDGSGISGYLAKFTASGTISTGESFYDSNNNLFFGNNIYPTHNATSSGDAAGFSIGQDTGYFKDLYVRQIHGNISFESGTGGAFTSGSIPFIGPTGTVLEDNANFFWDDFNNRLGIGTASPAAKLDVRGSAIFNEDSADVDFRIESNGLAYALYLDGGKNALVFGANTDVSSADTPFFIDLAARTATATTNFDRFKIGNSAAITIPTGTTSLVTSAHFTEPNITATGTVTTVATVYIAGAASEAGTNYALWVDSGNVQFDGNLDVDGTITLGSLDGLLLGNGASAITALTGTATYLPRWATGDGTTLVDSTITDDGTTVTINTALTVTSSVVGMAKANATGNIAYIRSIGGTNNPGIFFNAVESTGISTIDFSGSTGFIGMLALGTVPQWEIANHNLIGQTASTISTSSGALTLAPASGSNLEVTMTGVGYVNITASGADRSLESTSSGLKTGHNYGTVCTNTSTSDTASISKHGIYVNSVGLWDGGSNPNYAIYIAGASGGDTNWAIYNATAADVYLGTGNVGIGTTAPSTLLHVYRNAAGSSVNITGGAVGSRNDTGIDFSIINSTSVVYGRIAQQVTTASIGAEVGGLVFSTINSGTLAERMFIQGDGKVGIGTTSPGDLLHLYSTASNKPILRIENANDDANAPRLYFIKTNSAGATVADNDEFMRIYGWGQNDATTPEDIEAFLLIGKMTDVTDASEASAVDMYTYAAGSQTATLSLNAGNVGIGTTSPTRPLSVKADSNGYNIGLNDSGDTERSWIYSISTGSVWQTAASMKLQLNGSNGTGLIVDNASNVGIGIAAPGHKLNVYGTGNTAIEVQGNGTASLGYLSARADGDPVIQIGQFGSAATGTTFGIANTRLSVIYTTTYATTQPLGMAIGNNTAIPIYFATNQVVRFTIDGSSTTLTGNGASTIATSSGNLIFQPVGVSSFGTDAQLNGNSVLWNEAGVRSWTMGTAASTGTLTLQSGDSAGVFRVYTASLYANGVLQVAGTGDSYILGNVGIGTTSPIGKLDLKDGSFYLTDTDVSHGMTTYFPDGAFGGLLPYTAAAGGLMVAGASDTDSIALHFRAYVGSSAVNTVPAISFEAYKKAAAGSGIQDISATEIYFQIKDAAFNMLGNGKVGIGTTAPQALLHISGATSPGVMISDTDAGADVKHYEFYAESGKAYIRRLTDAFSGYDPTITFDSSKVGIGTTAPAASLHVGAAPTGNAASVCDVFVKSSLNTEGALRGVDATGNYVCQIYCDSSYGHLDTSYLAGSPTMGLKFGVTAAGVNATAMTILSTGLVGIGDVAPTDKLSIQYASAGSGGIGFRSASYASQARIIGIDDNTDGSGQLAIYTRLAGDIEEKVRITSEGYVGIGTASPGSYDGESRNLVIFSTTTPGLTIATSTTTSRCAIRFADGITGNETYRGGIEYDHGTGSGGTADSMHFRTAAAIRMSINGDGKVGIGTTGPVTLLDVLGATADSGIIHVHSATSTNNNRSALMMSSVNVNGTVGNVSIECIHPNNQQSDMVFRTGATTQTDFGTERMRIDTSGKVGIGPTSGLLNVEAGLDMACAQLLRYSCRLEEFRRSFH